MALHGFLAKMQDIKSRDVAKAKSTIPHGTVRLEAENTPPPVCFLKALQKSSKEDIGIIAEIKKGSPSKGDIRPDLDPAVYAEAYSRGGARAISVLTESHYFKGNLKDLEITCSHSDLPVIRKDFTISSYQIYEAKKAGAASILLITTLLSKDQLRDYISLTRELKLEPLVEITSEIEFEQAYQCDAKVVDINNRNLQTLEVDPNVAKRIAAIIPEDIIPVEASGISSFQDIEKGLDSNVFNFLVGESIVRAEDTESFIRELRNCD